jgi:hypothetical protein
LRQPPLDFGPNLTFHEPYGSYPARRPWKRFMDDLSELSFPEAQFDLFVIDTAVSFVPLADRNPGFVRWALAQLELVADTPAGVLIINQSRNWHRTLAAFADIVIDMSIPRGQPATTRRRTFTGVGRYQGILQFANAELNAEGTDYTLSPDSPAPSPPLLGTLQAVLAESPMPLTRAEIVARWPGEAPRADTLWRTLARGVEIGLFIRSGAGTKAEAFRYGLRNDENAKLVTEPLFGATS